MEVLKNALAVGADKVYLLSDVAFAGADTLATAYTLAKTIEKIGSVDLVICGKQAIDGDTAQVGPGRYSSRFPATNVCCQGPRGRSGQEEDRGGEDVGTRKRGRGIVPACRHDGCQGYQRTKATVPSGDQEGCQGDDPHMDGEGDWSR